MRAMFVQKVSAGIYTVLFHFYSKCLSLKQVKEKESDLKAAEQRLIEDQDKIREQGAEDKKALDKQRLLLVRFKSIPLFDTCIKAFLSCRKMKLLSLIRRRHRCRHSGHRRN